MAVDAESGDDPKHQTEDEGWEDGGHADVMSAYGTHVILRHSADLAHPTWTGHDHPVVAVGSKTYSRPA